MKAVFGSPLRVHGVVLFGGYDHGPKRIAGKGNWSHRKRECGKSSRLLKLVLSSWLWGSDVKQAYQRLPLVQTQRISNKHDTFISEPP